MTFEEICKSDDCLLALYQEVQIVAGKIPRFSGGPLAKLDANFCSGQFWHALPRERGDFGMKLKVSRVIDSNPALHEYRDFILGKFWDAMPCCQHEIVEGTITRGHKADYSLPEIEPALAAEIAAGRCELLKRNLGPVGFAGFIEQLRHAAGLGPQPTYIDDKTPVPDDIAEPVFVVRNEGDGVRLKLDLRYRERFEAGEISRWYARNSVYICDAKTRRILLSTNLTKESITGALSWKPVVLTFRDDELERKLSGVCTQVVTVEGKREKGEEYPRYDLEEMRRAIKDIAPVVEVGIQDMPVEVLDGWLGDVCRKHMAGLSIAYAWTALLTAASVLMPNMGKIRANLFTALVGPVGTGKTSAFELAFWLLNLKDPVLMNLKAGSGEGMAERIGDIGGARRLVFVNELAHMLAKVNYEGSTFEQFLNDAYYGDKQELTVARRKQIVFNARITLAGGLPENKFQDLFGTGTSGGFHDRAIFGIHPSNDYEPYPWQPLEGDSPLFDELGATASESADYPFGDVAPLRPGRPQPITIDRAVWDEKTRWQKELGLSGRAAESGIRAAIICAAFDCRGTLRVADLGPALAFAKYQDAIHKRYQPNPGKTNEGVVGHKILEYLKMHCPDGEKWIARREMLNSVNAYDFGPGIPLRALSGLESSGEIEQTKNGRQWLVRLNPAGARSGKN